MSWCTHRPAPARRTSSNCSPNRIAARRYLLCRPARWRTTSWPTGSGAVGMSESPPVISRRISMHRSSSRRSKRKKHISAERGPTLLVIDEYQMIGDDVRGVNYELAIALAPHETQLLLLSGSVANPQDIVGWLQRIGRESVLVSHPERPVPLEEVDLEALPNRNRKPSGGHGRGDQQCPACRPRTGLDVCAAASRCRGNRRTARHKPSSGRTADAYFRTADTRRPPSRAITARAGSVSPQRFELCTTRGRDRTARKKWSVARRRRHHGSCGRHQFLDALRDGDRHAIHGGKSIDRCRRTNCSRCSGALVGADWTTPVTLYFVRMFRGCVMRMRVSSNAPHKWIGQVSLASCAARPSARKSHSRPLCS